MKILSIESSCDETAAAITEDGRKVLSSVIATQIDEHKLYGGVVPEIASRRHCENITGVCAEALEKADMTLDDVDAVAVTNAPGLIGALLVGVNFAKGLALAKNNCPLRNRLIIFNCVKCRSVGICNCCCIICGFCSALYLKAVYARLDKLGDMLDKAHIL